MGYSNGQIRDLEETIDRAVRPGAFCNPHSADSGASTSRDRPSVWATSTGTTGNPTLEEVLLKRLRDTGEFGFESLSAF